MTRSIDVLGISGSLRRGSWNTGVLRAASEVLPANMTLEICDIAQLPFYNQDIDGSAMPDAVRRLKERIAKADGLLFATPEYNYSIPGVLKNAVDWASRSPKDSPLTGKPVAMTGAGGVMGTVRAQLHLRQVLLHNGALILPKPELYIARGWEKFDPEGNLTDDPTRQQVKLLLEAFAAWIERLNPGPRPTT